MLAFFFLFLVTKMITRIEMKIFEKIKDQIKNFQNIKDKKNPQNIREKKKKGFAFFFF